MFNLRNYAKGTWVETFGPFATFTRTKDVCPDGAARVVRLAATADSYFSVPASLSYRGKTVSGFICWASDSGLSTDREQWVKSTPTGKHKDIFAKETQP